MSNAATSMKTGKQVPDPEPLSPKPQPDMPGKGQKPYEYLLARGWFPLGNPESDFCLWYEPNFHVLEKSEYIMEDMTGERERYEAGKQALLDGKISENPEPRKRRQLHVTPASTPVGTAWAYKNQLYLDLREREEKMRAEQRAAQAAE